MTDPTTASIASANAERDHLRAEVDRLRRLLAEALSELEDTGGPFARHRAAEIRQELGA